MAFFIAIGVVVLSSLVFVLLSAALAAIKSRPRQEPTRRVLVHSINDDRCTGCDACVSVCPTDVLELVDNKSRVQRFDDCIQCEQCANACPTTALVMHFQGTKPPPFRMPSLDEHYQAAPGLYLIGEAAGKPLVKNASNLGRAVVEHMVRRGGLQASRSADLVDVMIVGSGPGGLSAALSCIDNGLSYAVIEKDELIASTIARWPVGKDCMAEPYDVKCVGLLPVFDSGKDELLAAWRTILDRKQLRVSTREVVEDVRRVGELFEVKTSKKVYRAQRVVMGIGTRGKPRRLGVPGEHLPKVTALLNDPADHRGQRVIVVGGGDSAVEAAIALAASASRVMLSYRGKKLSRCKGRNRAQLDELQRAGRIDVRFGSNITEILPDKVQLKTGSSYETLQNDHVFVCIGGDAPVKWLEGVGVKFVEQPHLFQRGPTDQLVEALLGPLAETTREGAGGGPSEAVLIDGVAAGVAHAGVGRYQRPMRLPVVVDQRPRARQPDRRVVAEDDERTVVRLTDRRAGGYRN